MTKSYRAFSGMTLQQALEYFVDQRSRSKVVGVSVRGAIQDTVVDGTFDEITSGPHAEDAIGGKSFTVYMRRSETRKAAEITQLTDEISLHAAKKTEGAAWMRTMLATATKPAIIYVDGRTLANRSELRAEAYAVAYETQHMSQFKMVIYHASALAVELYQQFAELKNVRLIGGSFKEAFKQYGKIRRAKQVRVVDSETLKTSGAVDNFLWKDQSDIWAALVHAISDKAVYGIRKVKGIYRVVDQFLRDALENFRASLVIRMAA